MITALLLSLISVVLSSSVISVVGPALVVWQPFLIIIGFARLFNQNRLMWSFALLTGVFSDFISSSPFGVFTALYLLITLIFDLIPLPKNETQASSQTVLLTFLIGLTLQGGTLMSLWYRPWYAIILPSLYSGFWTALILTTMILIVNKFRLYAR